MKYASNGDLHKYLQKNFTNITWNIQKLLILYDISKGLQDIHNKRFMHRDFHSGNILCVSGSNYISELEDDTNTESLSSLNLNFAIRNFSTSLNSNYISEELEFDILDNESSTIQNYSTTLDSSRYISAELELDIKTESYSRYISAELELDINTERSQNLKKRRNKEFLNLETHDNSGKRIKTNFSYLP
ncbi:kinase-like domain-containing protein [Rhizophagus irregularis DAOM 181602=DAOM 197198]|nr:kinase-like domain-containing protein [Rhizophagus irregularis DAOM 181602=DAOM 197198]